MAKGTHLRDLIVFFVPATQIPRQKLDLQIDEFFGPAEVVDFGDALHALELPEDLELLLEGEPGLRGDDLDLQSVPLVCNAVRHQKQIPETSIR